MKKKSEKQNGSEDCQKLKDSFVEKELFHVSPAGSDADGYDLREKDFGS